MRLMPCVDSVMQDLLALDAGHSGACKDLLSSYMISRLPEATEHSLGAQLV